MPQLLPAVVVAALVAGLLYWQTNTPPATDSPSVTDPNTTAAEVNTKRLYKPRDFSKSGGSSLNMSIFAFRDQNRNGIYDLGDHPLAHLAVLMTSPDGADHLTWSNINGFGNYKMSAAGKGEIVDSGEYRFEAQIPPGWSLTTGNKTQLADFSLLTGSVAGIICDNPPTPLGLAPNLTIAGKIPTAVASTLRLEVTSPEGRNGRVRAREDGAFRVPASVGKWTLTLIDGATGQRRQRTVNVTDTPIYLGNLTLTEREPVKADRLLVQDFEYLEHSTIDKMANGHLGLGWDFLLAVDNQLYKGPGYVNVLRSGRMVGYNSSGHPVTVSGYGDNERFDFAGAYFAVAWNNAERETLILDAWRDGEKVAHDEVPLSHLGSVWVDADYRDIDRLELRTAHYWQFAVDDMHFRVNKPPTPPGT